MAGHVDEAVTALSEAEAIWRRQAQPDTVSILRDLADSLQLLGQVLFALCRPGGIGASALAGGSLNTSASRGTFPYCFPRKSSRFATRPEPCTGRTQPISAKSQTLARS